MATYIRVWLQGTYDRMDAMLGADIHPVDILLLWAAAENDTPKVAELLRAGADVSAKVRMRASSDLCSCFDNRFRASVAGLMFIVCVCLCTCCPMLMSNAVCRTLMVKSRWSWPPRRRSRVYCVTRSQQRPSYSELGCQALWRRSCNCRDTVPLSCPSEQRQHTRPG